ncbi:hypothetical protein CTI14_56005 [Methylobacterium radiotolerans]|nr:hypothetical protein CTI14_56005 [Methylobacterium radiotolerans]
MREHGITVRQTAVGDRYVLEDMNEGGYALGGERSTRRATSWTAIRSWRSWLCR